MRSVTTFALALLVAACGAGNPERDRAAIRQDTAPDVLFRRGEAAQAVGDLTRAEQYFVASQKSGGDEKAIVRKLLVVCVADQRFPVALDYAEQYLHRHPRDVDVSFAAASLHAAAGDRSRARTLLERVVADRPRWADAHYALATVLREQGAPSADADVQDLEYLRLAPDGVLAEAARARLTKAAP